MLSHLTTEDLYEQGIIIIPNSTNKENEAQKLNKLPKWAYDRAKGQSQTV